MYTEYKIYIYIVSLVLLFLPFRLHLHVKRGQCGGPILTSKWVSNGFIHHFPSHAENGTRVVMPARSAAVEVVCFTGWPACHKVWICGKVTEKISQNRNCMKSHEIVNETRKKNWDLTHQNGEQTFKNWELKFMNRRCNQQKNFTGKKRMENVD